MLAISISRKTHYFNNRPRYFWPNPLNSEEQAAKYYGGDIEAMTELDKWLERKRLEAVLPWVDEKAILFTDLSKCPIKVITRRGWALRRLKKLNGLPHRAGIGKYFKADSR